MVNLITFLLIGCLPLLLNSKPIHNADQKSLHSDGHRRFADKVVIITGSSSGIGQEAAIAFAREGAKLVIHGRDEARLEETKKKIEQVNKEHGMGSESEDETRVISVAGSIEKEDIRKEIVQKAHKTFKRIDVLINNAGVVMKPGTEDHLFDLQNLDFLYDIGLRSIVDLSHLALPHLEESKGVVLNVSSLASIRPVAIVPVYSTMKAALDQWTRALAQNYGTKGVRVNAINPGAIANTRLERDLIKESENPEEDKKAAEQRDARIAKMSLLGRLGTVQEIAAVMKFLCSDDASYITGTTLVVDGGMSLYP